MSVDFVIITALKEEQEALIARLLPVQRLPPTDDDVHVYYQTELLVTLSGGATGTYTLILLSIMGMTREKAAIFTSDALHRWHPRYVLLVGIAGGIAVAKVARGDVLISEQIVDYEHQKITATGEREHRWEVHQSDPRLLEASRHLGDGWRTTIKKRRPQPGRPTTFFGPIATGDKVVNYLPFLRDLLSHWPELIGVEMESGGVATAAFQAAKAAGFFMIRGVSDLAENKDDTWRQYACHTAAAYTLALLQSGPVPLAVPIASETMKPSEPADILKEPTPQKQRSGRRWPLLTGGTLGLISLLVVLIISFRSILFMRGGPSPIPTTPDQITITALQIPYPPYKGTLLLNDPLQGNSGNSAWDEGTDPKNGSCTFTGGAYHVATLQVHYFWYCPNYSSTFNDFAYQVRMTIIKGDEGGIAFRISAPGSLYYFYFDTQGNYLLKVNENHNLIRTISSGFSSAIKKGYKQPNLIAVVAKGNSFDLYVNLHHLAHVSDAIFSSGQIGVLANEEIHPTEVVFSNAEVWKL